MPLIEYECQSCHKHVEKIQSFSAPPLNVCPSCGGAMEQTISAPAVQFKGSGWYVNDYAKSGGQKKSSDGDSSDTKKTDSSSDSGSKTEGSSPKTGGASPKKESASTPAPSTTPSTSNSSSSKSD